MPAIPEGLLKFVAKQIGVDHMVYEAYAKQEPTRREHLEFRSTQHANPDLLALDTIHELNESGKQKVSEDSPFGFVSKRWERYVYDEGGSINRHFYELAAFTQLQNYVLSGEISIIGNRQHKDFDEYLVSQQEWAESKDIGTRLAVLWFK